MVILGEASSGLQVWGTWIQFWIRGSSRVLQDLFVSLANSNVWRHLLIHVWIRGSTLILEEASSRLRLFGTTPCAFYNTKKSSGCGRKACRPELAAFGRHRGRFHVIGMFLEF